MIKDGNKKAVKDAYAKLEELHTPEIMKRMGVAQVAQMVQEELPQRPICGLSTIQKILFRDISSDKQ